MRLVNRFWLFILIFTIGPLLISHENLNTIVIFQIEFYTLFRFLLQCLEDLDRSLRKLNSRLFVIRGQPADALPKLFKVSPTIRS